MGAGECANKGFCRHLDYLAQDIAEYDGTGDGTGLHTGQWDTSSLDFICDLYDIARLNARLIAHFDGDRMARNSSQLQTFGWFVVARKL